MGDAASGTLFATPEHLDVAADILRADFGEAAERTASHLLANGAATLRDVALALRLPLSHVKNALLVLLQHNVVRVADAPAAAQTGPSLLPGAARAAGAARRAPSASPTYAASLDEALARRWLTRLSVAVRAAPVGTYIERSESLLTGPACMNSYRVYSNRWRLHI